MNETRHSMMQIVRSPKTPPLGPSVSTLTEQLLERFGDNVQALLLYGSCLRSGDARGQIVDLYVLVDSYKQTYGNRVHALLNRILPPNVYYLEAKTSAYTARAKYAVLSLGDFERGTSLQWFHSYLWGRFAQPTALTYVRDEGVRERIYRALATAGLTLAQRTLPTLPEDFGARLLWETALGLSYSAELRAEKRERARDLVASAPDYYEQLARAALGGMPYVVATLPRDEIYFHAAIKSSTRRAARAAWALRRLQGKLLSLLRLIKGLATFDGGVDYIAWKIQRHSGIAIPLTPWLRRHPLLGGWVVLWRLYRSGGVR